MVKKESKFNWGSFLIGIVFVIASMVAFRDPESDLVAIVMVFGVTALLEGIYQIAIRRTIKEVTGYKSTFMILVGILNILIGIILLFNVYEGVLVLPYVFAIWFIIRCVEGLISSDLAKSVSDGYYWFTLIINLLGIVLGIMLFTNPLSSIMTIAYIVGFYFMLFGILNIVEAFTSEKQ
ncbi:HdeD family acid-resistance protein [Miniphocaeibacter massiliensis]|uniref:HdeD family acid-resistance protein n=1 Tax=Miniphocaeibacter massiliensis TaxID=2041841 RepID=UPI000C068F0B|nr:DUF308 domain-containing protein [Miniphocaeibacter massiliensis]